MKVVGKVYGMVSGNSCRNLVNKAYRDIVSCVFLTRGGHEGPSDRVRPRPEKFVACCTHSWILKIFPEDHSQENTSFIQWDIPERDEGSK